MSFTRGDLVNYRVAQAKDALKEAKLLANHNHWNSTVNRLYYSCFYIVTALLAQNQLETKTHSGVRVLFHQHFVKEDIVSKSSAEFFSDLFNKRQEGDYEDFFNFDQATVLPLIDKTEKFLNEIESKI